MDEVKQKRGFYSIEFQRINYKLLIMKFSLPFQANFLAFGGFVLYFILLFILFPLQNAFIGNSDAIVHVAYFYEHWHELQHFISGKDFGSAYFPEAGIGAYMETYFGETVFFFIGKLLTGSDVWAFFILYVAMYALNGWSVYLLSNYYSQHRWAAFVAGIIFSSSCFMMSTLELMNGVAFFCIPFSIYFLERFIDEKKYRFLALSAFILSIESLFSAYHFFMGSLVWLVLMVTRFKHVIQFDFKKLIAVVIPAVLVAIPLVLKILSSDIATAYNPIQGEENVYALFSMNLKSFMTSIPGNLIYPRPDEVEFAIKTSYRGNLGVICLLLFIFGISRKSLRRYTFLIILLVATAVSFGPYTFINGQKINLPTAFIYNSEFFGTFFRMPGRAFVISNFIIALFCGIGFKAVLKWLHLKRASFVFAGLVVLLFTIENQAIPPYIYQHKSLVNVPEEYDAIKGEQLANIADFPSSLFTSTGYVNGISEFTREYRYHYWQAKHQQNTINGSASYYPKTRMENNERMMKITEPNQLDALIKINQLDYIVFHKELVLFEEELELEAFFRNSPQLKLKLDGERLVIFNVIDGSE
jgi:hypothetical protein